MQKEVRVDVAELTRLFVACSCGVETGLDLEKELKSEVRCPCDKSIIPSGQSSFIRSLKNLLDNQSADEKARMFFRIPVVERSEKKEAKQTPEAA